MMVMVKFEKLKDFSDRGKMEEFLRGHPAIKGKSGKTRYYNRIYPALFQLSNADAARLDIIWKQEEFLEDVDHLIFMYSFRHNFEWEIERRGKTFELYRCVEPDVWEEGDPIPKEEMEHMELVQKALAVTEFDRVCDDIVEIAMDAIRAMEETEAKSRTA